MESVGGPVLGVVGGCGGVGASSFAAVLARAAGAVALIDVDVDTGGIDVLLGLEDVPGARWSGLRLAGGALDAEVLLSGLPSWQGTAVLAADVGELAGAAVGQVVDAAARAGAVVLDLPRRDCPERAAAVQRCDLVVQVARADVGGLVAAHTVLAALGAARCGVVVRRGEVGPADAARLVGVDLLGTLEDHRRLDPARPPRAVARLAGGIVAGLPRSSVPARAGSSR